MPRTGTLTQKMALELLGVGPCYHMVNVLADLDQAGMWSQALAGGEPWPQLFTGFQSTVDWPGGYFYRELAEYYPEAKVVLSVRDPETWEQSVRETVWAVRNGDSPGRLLASARAHIDPEWNAFLQMIDALLWQGTGTFAAGHASAEQLIDGMLSHNEEVRRTIAPERLLVWDVREGWEPLCDFLELPIPDVPLPHINDRVEFLNRIVDGALESLIAWRAVQATIDPATATEDAAGEH